MKIKRAVFAGLIALSIIGLAACSAKVDISTDQSKKQSTVASSTGAEGSESDDKSNASSGEEGTESAAEESKPNESESKYDNSDKS